MLLALCLGLLGCGQKEIKVIEPEYDLPEVVEFEEDEDGASALTFLAEEIVGG